MSPYAYQAKFKLEDVVEGLEELVRMGYATKSKEGKYTLTPQGKAYVADLVAREVKGRVDPS